MQEFNSSDETFFQVQVEVEDHWEVWRNFKTLTEARRYCDVSPHFKCKFRIVQALIVDRYNHE